MDFNKEINSSSTVQEVINDSFKTFINNDTSNNINVNDINNDVNMDNIINSYSAKIESLTYALAQAQNDYKSLKNRTEREKKNIHRDSFCKVILDVFDIVYQDLELMHRNDNLVPIDKMFLKIKDFLLKNDLIVIDSLYIKEQYNNKFSDEFAEASFKLNACDEKEHNKIAEIFSPGLLDNKSGKVLKHAKVSVKCFIQ